MLSNRLIDGPPQKKPRQSIYDKTDIQLKMKTKRMERILPIDRDVQQQGQNRMDEFELTDLNKTFNVVLKYDEMNPDFLNKKVINV